MTNGTTGFPVAPIAEDEAMRLSSMFSRLADAVVQASTMPKTIEDLQGQVSRLSQDLEARTLHADELDRTIHELREQRNSAESQRDMAYAELDTVNRQLGMDTRTIAEQQTKLNTLYWDLDDTKAERDDYGLKALKLEDELAQARAALSDIQAKIAAFFPTPAPKAAEPELPKSAEPVTMPDFVPLPADEPAIVELPKWEDTQTAKTPEPSPEAPPRRYLESWEPGASWDGTEGKYYLDH